jgi:hypothetical protein
MNEEFFCKNLASSTKAKPHSKTENVAKSFVFLVAQLDGRAVAWKAEGYRFVERANFFVSVSA